MVKHFTYSFKLNKAESLKRTKNFFKSKEFLEICSIILPNSISANDILW